MDINILKYFTCLPYRRTDQDFIIIIIIINHYFTRKTPLKLKMSFERQPWLLLDDNILLVLIKVQIFFP